MMFTKTQVNYFSCRLAGIAAKMVLFGQDVLVSGGELAFSAALQEIAVLGGYALGSIPGGMAGYALSAAADALTSAASFVYDIGRLTGNISNRVSIGFFLDDRLGYKRPMMAILLYDK